MLLSEFKRALTEVDKVQFVLPNGSMVPPHFHVTEVGENTKRFIDCGNTVREVKTINMQVWYTIDVNHRLSSYKLLGILNSSERKLNLSDEELIVEYQTDTKGIYSVEWLNGVFHLKPVATECLAEDHCGIPQVVEKVTSCCGPESGCC